VTDAGMLTTASDILIHRGREGYFLRARCKTGKELWKTNLGGSIVNAPITYQIDGKQYVTTISGHTLVTFALRNYSVSDCMKPVMTCRIHSPRGRAAAGWPGQQAVP